MKRSLLSAATFICCVLTLAACSNFKKKQKEVFVKECIQGGGAQFTDPKLRGYFNEYCECAGEKTVEKFSKAEWEEFDKMKKMGQEAEMQAKLMPVIQPCLDELQKKAMEGNK